jgi:hypothetical protein
MSSKDTKQKLKDAPSSTMEEMFRRGEVSEFEHLKDNIDYSKKVEQNADSTK